MYMCSSQAVGAQLYFNYTMRVNLAQSRFIRSLQPSVCVCASLPTLKKSLCAMSKKTERV